VLPLLSWMWVVVIGNVTEVPTGTRSILFQAAQRGPSACQQCKPIKA